MQNLPSDWDTDIRTAATRPTRLIPPMDTDTAEDLVDMVVLPDIDHM